VKGKKMGQGKKEKKDGMHQKGGVGDSLLERHLGKKMARGEGPHRGEGSDGFLRVRNSCMVKRKKTLRDWERKGGKFINMSGGEIGTRRGLKKEEDSLSIYS